VVLSYRISNLAGLHWNRSHPIALSAAKLWRFVMWISICALTLAMAIICSVASTMMQPKDDRFPVRK